VTDGSGKSYYGGNQDWFTEGTYGDNKTTIIPIYDVDSGQYDYFIYQWSAEDAKKYRENILKGKGCGIVSATNIEACLYAEIRLQDYADSLV